MINTSETIANKAVLVHHSHCIHHNPQRAKAQAGQPFFALFHHSPACTPCHIDVEKDIYIKMPPIKKYTIRMKIIKILHGSAISNAKQHSSHDRIDHHTSTNEGKNEGLPGLTTSA